MRTAVELTCLAIEDRLADRELDHEGDEADAFGHRPHGRDERERLQEGLVLEELPAPVGVEGVGGVGDLGVADAVGHDHGVVAGLLGGAGQRQVVRRIRHRLRIRETHCTSPVRRPGTGAVAAPGAYHAARARSSCQHQHAGAQPRRGRAAAARRGPSGHRPLPRGPRARRPPRHRRDGLRLLRRRGRRRAPARGQRGRLGPLAAPSPRPGRRWPRSPRRPPCSGRRCARRWRWRRRRSRGWRTPRGRWRRRGAPPRRARC